MGIQINPSRKLTATGGIAIKNVGHAQHAVGEAFSLRFWYELPFSLGISPVTVDFNSQQTVIGKYQWNSP